MCTPFKRGDHGEWNSEAGWVRGVIIKKALPDILVKRYLHYASRDEPQYLIKNGKTDHVAIRKGKALKLIRLGRTGNRASQEQRKGRGDRCGSLLLNPATHLLCVMNS